MTAIEKQQTPTSRRTSQSRDRKGASATRSVRDRSLTVAAPIVVRACSQTLQRALCALVVALLCPLIVMAHGTTPKHTDTQNKKDADFWVFSPHTKEAAAVQVIAAGHPITSAALLSRGKQYLIWGQELAPIADAAPKLSRVWLQAVTDDRPFPNVQGKLPEEILKREHAEIKAYAEAVVNAVRTPPDLFAKSAKDNDWITWGHLYFQPKRYRGDVVPMEGKLVRLRRYDPPWEARRQEFTLKHIYEGWVFTDTPRANPICVMFTKKPKDVPLGERIDYRIRFNGYFFKRYQYPAEKGKRLTLFFIAPTFEVVNSGAPPRGAAKDVTITDSLISGGIIVFAVGAGTVVLIMGIGWWYRRNDDRIHSRLAELKAGNLELPNSDDDNRYGIERANHDEGLTGDDDGESESLPLFPAADDQIQEAESNQGPRNRLNFPDDPLPD